MLDCEESWAPKNWCFWIAVLEKTLESPLDCKEIQPLHPKGDQSWVFIGRTDVEAETPILWPPHAKSWLIGKDWCWEGLGAGGKGDDRGGDGWMASPTRWTWVWANSRSWWWTGRPGVLQFMGLQRVRHDWATELNRTSWGGNILFTKRLRNLPSMLLPPEFKFRHASVSVCRSQGEKTIQEKHFLARWCLWSPNVFYFWCVCVWPWLL